MSRLGITHKIGFKISIRTLEPVNLILYSANILDFFLG